MPTKMIAAVEPSTCCGAARALDQRADPDPQQRDAGADQRGGDDLEDETATSCAREGR